MSSTEIAITTLSCLKPFHLLLVFATDLQEISGGKRFWNSLIFGSKRRQHLRGQNTWDREADTVTVRNWLRRLIFGICHLSGDLRYLPQRHTLIAGHGVDIGILHVRQSGALLHAQAGGDGDLFV